MDASTDPGVQSQEDWGYPEEYGDIPLWYVHLYHVCREVVPDRWCYRITLIEAQSKQRRPLAVTVKVWYNLSNVLFAAEYAWSVAELDQIARSGTEVLDALYRDCIGQRIEEVRERIEEVKIREQG